jgi:hypothetical protein
MGIRNIVDGIFVHHTCVRICNTLGLLSYSGECIELKTVREDILCVCTRVRRQTCLTSVATQEDCCYDLHMCYFTEVFGSALKMDGQGHNYGEVLKAR